MPSLYISEYEQVVDTTVGKVLAPQCPPHAEQKLAIGGAAVPSATLQARTKFVRLSCDAACSVAFSSNPATDPVATANNLRLAANQTEYFGTVPGTKISVISNT